MANYEGILLGMGNPLLDIVAVVDKSFLKKYGLQVKDNINAEEKHMPMYDELVQKYGFKYNAGGATQNTIKVAQWMLQISGATNYMGSIGKDQFGEEMKEKLKSAGVNVHYYEDETAPTGTCAVCLVDGQTTFVTNLSASSSYTPEYLKRQESWALVEKAKCIYIEGYFLMVSPESILLAAKHAAANNKVFVMSLSDPFVCEFYHEDQDKALLYTDYIFGSEDGARAFSKVRGWELEDVEDIALKMASLPKATGTRKRVTVITRGCNPVIVAEGGKVNPFSVSMLPEENVVDATAADDAFVGGFLSQLIKEKSIEECVKAGCYASSVVVQNLGCTYPEKPDFS